MRLHGLKNNIVFWMACRDNSSQKTNGSRVVSKGLVIPNNPTRNRSFRTEERVQPQTIIQIKRIATGELGNTSFSLI
jgi:hypothetical protein